MTSRALLVILALLLGAQGASTGAVPGEDQSTLCGRVVAVTCEGPASPVTLHLIDPQGSSNWWVIIPPEQRQLFGSRIENRYEQRLVCVPTATATTNGQRVLVKDPSQIVVKDVQESIPLPDDVARSCNPDIRMPTLVRDVKPHYTADALRAKVRGTVYLQGIVDRDGKVRDVRIVRSLEPSLDAAARDALAQWEFRPATREGKPVAIAFSAEMAFTTQ